jgi:MoaA/NifB/PqqE/SkfB family radical SAM enzyme
MQIEAFCALPISYQGLVVESTSSCNARCGMCYQAAGPRGSDILGRAHLHEQDISRVLGEAITISSMDKRFHLAGGEAFLKIDECLRLFAVARDLGYNAISTTTNGYWGRRLSDARAIALQARAVGLRRMEISWDFWHLSYVSPQAVSNCLLAAAEAGISTNLRILTTRSHTAEEALTMLDEEALGYASEINSCPVFPTGRAADMVKQNEVFFTGDLGASCHGTLHLTVNALGNVAPCCAGADQTDGLSFGNIHDRSIKDIADSMEQSLMLRTLVFLGPGVFLGILEENGINIGRSFANICHLCWEIASNAKLINIVKGYFEDLERQAVLDALERYLSSAVKIQNTRN